MTTTTNALTVNAPEGVPFVDSVREFDFPVEAVYRAHVDPTLIMDWLGPRGYVMDPGALGHHLGRRLELCAPHRAR